MHVQCWTLLSRSLGKSTAALNSCTPAGATLGSLAQHTRIAARQMLLPLHAFLPILVPPALPDSPSLRSKAWLACQTPQHPSDSMAVSPRACPGGTFHRTFRHSNVAPHASYAPDRGLCYAFWVDKPAVELKKRLGVNGKGKHVLSAGSRLCLTASGGLMPHGCARPAAAGLTALAREAATWQAWRVVPAIQCLRSECRLHLQRPPHRKCLQ